MKLFHQEFANERAKEEKVLRELTAFPTLTDRISALASLSPSQHSPFVLIMSRVGIHFARTSEQFNLTCHSSEPQPSASLRGPQYIRITPQIFGDLVDVLKELHTVASYVHRDVRVDNFFYCSETKKV